jgi:hypothetical protein
LTRAEEEHTQERGAEQSASRILLLFPSMSRILLLFPSVSRGGGCLTRDDDARLRAEGSAHGRAEGSAREQSEKRVVRAGAEGSAEGAEGSAPDKSAQEKRAVCMPAFFFLCACARAGFPWSVGTLFSFQCVQSVQIGPRVTLQWTRRRHTLQRHGVNDARRFCTPRRLSVALATP